VLALLALEARDRAAAELLVGYVVLLLAVVADEIHHSLRASPPLDGRTMHSVIG
jgi:hypothetical protein